MVGRLQFEVLTFRVENEYGAKIVFDILPYTRARWVVGPERADQLLAQRIPLAVEDQDGQLVALCRDDWEVDRAIRDNKDWTFRDTAPIRAPRS